MHSTPTIVFVLCILLHFPIGKSDIIDFESFLSTSCTGVPHVISRINMSSSCAPIAAVGCMTMSGQGGKYTCPSTPSFNARLSFSSPAVTYVSMDSASGSTCQGPTSSRQMYRADGNCYPSNGGSGFFKAQCNSETTSILTCDNSACTLNCRTSFEGPTGACFPSGIKYNCVNNDGTITPTGNLNPPTAAISEVLSFPNGQCSGLPTVAYRTPTDSAQTCAAYSYMGCSSSGGTYATRTRCVDTMSSSFSLSSGASNYLVTDHYPQGSNCAAPISMRYYYESGGCYATGTTSSIKSYCDGTSYYQEICSDSTCSQGCVRFSTQDEAPCTGATTKKCLINNVLVDPRASRTTVTTVQSGPTPAPAKLVVDMAMWTGTTCSEAPLQVSRSVVTQPGFNCQAMAAMGCMDIGGGNRARYACPASETDPISFLSSGEANTKTYLGAEQFPSGSNCLAPAVPTTTSFQVADGTCVKSGPSSFSKATCSSTTSTMVECDDASCSVHCRTMITGPTGSCQGGMIKLTCRPPAPKNVIESRIWSNGQCSGAPTQIARFNSILDCRVMSSMGCQSSSSSMSASYSCPAQMSSEFQNIPSTETYIYTEGYETLNCQGQATGRSYMRSGGCVVLGASRSMKMTCSATSVENMLCEDAGCSANCTKTTMSPNVCSGNGASSAMASCLQAKVELPSPTSSPVVVNVNGNKDDDKSGNADASAEEAGNGTMILIVAGSTGGFVLLAAISFMIVKAGNLRSAGTLVNTAPSTQVLTRSHEF